MKMRMKRITGFFLSLVMVMGFLPLNPIVSYANDNASGDVKIDDKNFPDPTFRDYVSQNFDKSHQDGKLSQNELDSVTEISISNKSVTSLQGIEYFKNLKELYCHHNKLKSLDVSHNTKLTELQCNGNKLTSLNVSNNTELNELICDHNELMSLDVSHNTKLTRLDCSCNKLKELDLSKNTKLKRLIYGDNNLTSLDLSKNTLFGPMVFSVQRYNITVIKGIRKFEYSKFPRGFDKDKVISASGAHFGGDALIVNDDNPSEVFYEYEVGNNISMRVKLNVTYFDPDLVRDIKVKKQPTKRVYTDGENLDLTGLVVTLTDEHSATVDVPFSEFQTYGIKATPKNGKELAPTDKKVALSVSRVSGFGSVTLTFTAETDALTVNPKVFDKDHVTAMAVIQQPTKLIYKDGEPLDLTGLKVKLTDNQTLTQEVEFKDFGKYSITATPDNGTVLKLGHNGNPVKLTRGNLTATTSALKVKAKESIPTHVGGGSTSTSTSGSGSAGGSAGGFSAGMNYYAPTTVDKDELNIQIDSAESDYKPGYAGDGSGAAVKQAADRLGDALAQAKRVAANPNATQAQVGASARKLADARKAQHEKPDPKPHHEKPDSKSHHEKQAPKSQTKKRIGMIHKTDKSASFAGLIAVLVGSIAVIGFSIAGFAILRRRK